MQCTGGIRSIAKLPRAAVRQMMTDYRNSFTVVKSKSNLGTGRVTTLGGRPIHSHRSPGTSVLAHLLAYKILLPHTTHHPNGISIKSAVFPQYTLIINGPTDRTNMKLELDR